MLRDGDGPYPVRVISHYDKVVSPPDNEYYVGEKPHRVAGLQIKFLGKIPYVYYHPGHEGLHRGAHNYIVWQDGVNKKELDKEDRKLGLHHSGFECCVLGYGKKPPKPYYKISKLSDKEERKKAKNKRRQSRHSRADSSSSSSSFSSLSFSD